MTSFYHMSQGMKMTRLATCGQLVQPVGTLEGILGEELAMPFWRLRRLREELPAKCPDHWGSNHWAAGADRRSKGSQADERARA